MSRVFVTKTSFTAGELDPQLLGRLDLKAQEDGAARLRNVLVRATGGVARRPGLARVAALPGAVRLVNFEAPFGPALLALGAARIDIVRGTRVIAGPASMWTEAQLADISWTRTGGRLLIVHPQVPPYLLVETAVDQFQLVRFEFETSGSDLTHTYQPYARFAAANVALELRDPDTGDSDDELDVGTVDLVASEPVFHPLLLGAVFRYKRHEIEIRSVDPFDRTRASGKLREQVENGKATRDWDEQAFGAMRGWPATVTVYQDRLVIGGSRDLPDWLWTSKTGRHANFDLGEALDDEGIAFRLGGDELHTIRGLQAGRQLQVFTNAGEWVVRGTPLAPTTAQLELQTRVGSWAARRLRPLDVDGATLFIGASGRELREFLFADSEQAYQAADIALLARHLLVDPIDIAFDGRRRLLLILRADGRAAAATIDRNSNVVGWTLLEAVGSAPCAWRCTRASPGCWRDRGARCCSRVWTTRWESITAARSPTPRPRTVWSGLGELEGQAVIAVSEEGGARLTVAGGAITLPGPRAGSPWARPSPTRSSRCRCRCRAGGGQLRPPLSTGARELPGHRHRCVARRRRQRPAGPDRPAARWRGSSPATTACARSAGGAAWASRPGACSRTTPYRRRSFPFPPRSR